jgi:heterodisulfide reductase subunit A
MAKIREHCSRVHEDKDKATEKARALVSAAVKRVSLHEPLVTHEVPVNPNVLVVGGGVAGIQAALEIAPAGHKIYLVEKQSSIGGHMAMFDKTFPTLDCAACILTPRMTQISQYPNIELLTMSQVEEVSGFIGNFKVKVKKRARYVDMDKCTGCNRCSELCPQTAPSVFESGLTKRKAIFIPFPQAVPNKASIDAKNCLHIKGLAQGKDNVCRLCQIGNPKKNIPGCEADAIDFSQKDEILTLDVGNIILAVGYDHFDPTTIYRYGMGRFPNIYSSLQFERITNASGPTSGKVLMADGRPPESVAIIHCVGSRDENNYRHCSRICCMSSLKYSHLVHEKVPGAEVYQLYTDIRCAGSGYEEFYERLQSEGVNFVRGRPGEITNIAEKPEEEGKLIINVEDTLIRRKRRIPVDIIILSCALEPVEDAEEIARIFSISLKGDGFFGEKHPKLDPVATTTDGIFVVGCCVGPKDIPDTVAQASAGAARVLATIAKGTVEVEAAIAVIDENKCSGCQVCIDLCPYKAISFDSIKKVSEINQAICKGCGTCVAACPSKAIRGKHFASEQIMAEIEGVLI